LAKLLMVMSVATTKVRRCFINLLNLTKLGNHYFANTPTLIYIAKAPIKDAFARFV
jgi:hypothetical protein